MTLRTQMADLAGGLEARARVLPEQMKDAEHALSEVGGKVRELTRKNPALVLAGAFALGYLLARIGRHA